MAATEFEFPPNDPLSDFDYERFEPVFISERMERNLGWQVARRALAHCVEVGYEVQQICQITRGGIDLCDPVSRVFGIQNVTTFGYVSYASLGSGKQDERLDQPKILQEPNLVNPDGEGTAFTEDLIDSGDTIRNSRERWPKGLYIATLSKQSPEITNTLVHVIGRIIQAKNPKKSAWYVYEKDLRAQYEIGVLETTGMSREEISRVTRKAAEQAKPVLPRD
jgi:hypoxanthine phosphoribosyltransferase